MTDKINSTNYISEAQDTAKKLIKSGLFTKDDFKLEMWQSEAKSIDMMIKDVSEAIKFINELKAELEKMRWNNNFLLIAYFMKN